MPIVTSAGTARSTAPRHWWGAAGVALVGGIVTAWAASRRLGRSYHYDEAVTIVEFVASGSPIHAFTNQVVVNNHPLFSAIQAVLWRLGATTETSQRITPILFGALAVAVLGWGVTRRLGLVAGSTAVLVVGLNAMFIAQTRQIRGYSLAVLGITVALFALAAWARSGRPGLLIVHGTAIAAAVMTHPYSVIAIAVMAAAVVAAGRADRRLLLTWAIAGATTIALLIPILGDTLAASQSRGRRFRSDFPLEAVDALLGPGRVAAAITGGLLVLGVITLAHRSRDWRHALLAGGAVATISIGTIWLVLRPLDLYPRFLITMLPLIAVGAAVGAWRAGPKFGTAAAVVLLVASIPSVRTEISFEPGIQDAARVVTATRDMGLIPCGRNILPLRVYTDAPRLVRTSDDLEGCDVMVVVGRAPEEISTAAAERYPQRWTHGGGITVFSTISRSELLGDG